MKKKKKEFVCDVEIGFCGFFFFFFGGGGGGGGYTFGAFFSFPF
jgi:hypothetical protein